MDNIYDTEELLKLIEQYRNKHRMSQNEFIKRAGIPRTNFFELKRGAYQLTSRSIQMFAKALDIPYVSLITRLKKTSLLAEDRLLEETIEMICSLNEEQLSLVNQQLKKITK